jgi:alpha-methylacyl-CoA racemase
MKERLAAVVATRTRDQWAAAFDGTDACVMPVLEFDEARAHPHNAARSTFVERDGVVQPAPAPRFSRTAAGIAGPPARAGEHTDAALADWGFSDKEIDALRAAGAVR